MSAVVMGIDPSGSLGWAIGNNGMKRPHFGLLPLPAGRSDDGLACSALARWLNERIDEHGISHFFYEEPLLPPGSSLRSRLVIFKIDGIIEMVGHDRRIGVFEAGISDWRKRFIGTNRAPPSFQHPKGASTQWFKQRAIEEAAKRGWLTDDHNVAEALGIMDYGLCCIDRSYVSQTDPFNRRAEEKSNERIT